MTLWNQNDHEICAPNKLHLMSRIERELNFVCEKCVFQLALILRVREATCYDIGRSSSWICPDIYFCK